MDSSRRRESEKVRERERENNEKRRVRVVLVEKWKSQRDDAWIDRNQLMSTTANYILESLKRFPRAILIYLWRLFPSFYPVLSLSLLSFCLLRSSNSSPKLMAFHRVLYCRFCLLLFKENKRSKREMMAMVMFLLLTEFTSRKGGEEMRPLKILTKNRSGGKIFGFPSFERITLQLLPEDLTHAIIIILYTNSDNFSLSYPNRVSLLFTNMD